jgi:hypothetical protein
MLSWRFPGRALWPHQYPERPGPSRVDPHRPCPARSQFRACLRLPCCIASTGAAARARRPHTRWVVTPRPRAACDAADVAGPDDPQLPADNVGQSTSRGEDITTRDGKEATAKSPARRAPAIALRAVHGAGRDRRQPAGGNRAVADKRSPRPADHGSGLVAIGSSPVATSWSASTASFVFSACDTRVR